MLFTENGIAMFSSVFSNDLAIYVNMAIMRTFSELRKMPSSNELIIIQLIDIQKGTRELFKIVFERLDDVDQKILSYEKALSPNLSAYRKRFA